MQESESMSEETLKCRVLFGLSLSLLVFMFNSCHQATHVLKCSDSFKPDLAFQFADKQLLISSGDLLKRMPEGDGIVDRHLRGKVMKLLAQKKYPRDTVRIQITDGGYLFNNNLDTLDRWFFSPRVYSVLLRNEAVLIKPGNKTAVLKKETVYGHCSGNKIRRTSKRFQLRDTDTKTIIADSTVWMRMVSCF